MRVFCGELGLAVVKVFTNASVLGTGETWLEYVLSMGRQAIHQKARPDPTTELKKNREKYRAGDKYECNSCENAITSQYY